MLKEEVERGERLDESSTPKQKKKRSNNNNNSSSNSTTATPKSTPKKDTLSCKSAFLSFSPFAFLFCALQHLRERHPVKDQQVTNTYTGTSSPAVKNSRISKPSSSTPKNRKKVIKEEEDADMPRHFDGEDELLGGGGEGGDFSVGFDQEDHLGSGFLS